MNECMYACMYVCVYIYIYIVTGSETDGGIEGASYLVFVGWQVPQMLQVERQLSSAAPCLVRTLPDKHQSRIPYHHCSPIHYRLFFFVAGNQILIIVTVTAFYSREIHFRITVLYFVNSGGREILRAHFPSLLPIIVAFLICQHWFCITATVLVTAKHSWNLNATRGKCGHKNADNAENAAD